MSARALAERASISPRYLSRLENGQVSPTVSSFPLMVQTMDGTLAPSLRDRAAAPWCGESMGATFGTEASTITCSQHPPPVRVDNPDRVAGTESYR